MSKVSTHQTPADVDKKTWCLTPMGYRRRANVHRVPTTHRARRRRDNSWELIEITSGDRQQLGTQTSAPAPTPVDLGSAGNEWASYGEIVNPGSVAFTLSEASWVVPPKPLTNTGQTIYLFNGLQHGDDDILQPVLVFGSYPSPSGEEQDTNGEWAIASFLVPKDSTSKPLLMSPGTVTVQAGGIVTGRVSLTGTDPATGDSLYLCEFVGFPSTRLATSIEFCDLCVVTLELWDVDDTAQLPPNTAKTPFTGLRSEISNAPCNLPYVPSGPWPCQLPAPATVDVVYPH